MNKAHDYQPSAPPIATAVVVDTNQYSYNHMSYDNVTTYSSINIENNIQPTQTQQNNKLLKFRDFIMKYEISNEYAIKLRQLEGFDVVIICDDSSSMNTVVSTPNTKDFMSLPTRWEEMRTIVKIIMEATMLLDDDGIDVYFLNRPEEKNVCDMSKIDEMFVRKPNGYTPIVETLQRVIADKKQSLAEKKLLIILATDGEPTDRSGHIKDSRGFTEINKLYNVLNTSRIPKEKIYTTILACTDDDSTVEYLDNWDKQLHNFDLVDDYYSERERIQNAQGKSYRFSYGDYVVKILLGSIDKSIGAMDGSSADYRKTCQNNDYDTYHNEHFNYDVHNNKQKRNNSCIIL